MTFRKNDTGKPMLSHLPAAELELVVRVLDHGAAKYGRDNWKRGNFHAYASAALRHLFARLRGEVMDRETGLPHLAHAVCCLLFLMHYDLRASAPGDIHADWLDTGKPSLPSVKNPTPVFKRGRRFTRLFKINKHLKCAQDYPEDRQKRENDDTPALSPVDIRAQGADLGQREKTQIGGHRPSTGDGAPLNPPNQGSGGLKPSKPWPEPSGRF